MHRTVIAAALLFLAACEPVPQDPVRVRALVLSGNGSYITQEVTLNTLTDIIRMEGDVAKLIGGARIVLDSTDPEQQAASTEEGFANALVQAEGRPVTANWITQDNVLWPADFHTWNLVTAYYNFEKSREYFNTVGNIPLADFGGPATVYYFPDFILKDANPEPIKDNALWFAPTQSFMLAPFDALQRAPLAINSGIMSHEYAHMVFNRKVYGSRRLPPPILEWGAVGASPGANLIKALDEGLADYHGYGVTCKSATGCDSRFFRTSFDDNLSNDRDLAKTDRCVDAFMRDQLNNAALGTFSAQGLEYKLGSILASALYQAGESTGQREVLMRAIISAYSDETANNPGLKQLVTLSQNNQQNFNLTSVAAVFIKHVTDVPLKTALCNELIDHLQIPAASLVGPGLPCPAAAQGGNTCTKLPPP
ncbi:hypothetical protein [Hyalangium sp.]|uniref:hypothetical protein n=1 Tax=Hyalangium sp. TaxID=2028555 RepID=UPI002D4F877D|nr:hypothetical protein [Hyalangium sp.]HYH95221.1 hypothetical protein [Hyalangium sp.]